MTRPRHPLASVSDEERAAIVEMSIEQAIRRGDFDDLPGAGKPIPGSGRRTTRTGGSAARSSASGSPASDRRRSPCAPSSPSSTSGSMRCAREPDVREYLEDFNRRVIEARRQLLGGPPVVTPTVDVDERVGQWSSATGCRARRDRGAPQTDDLESRRTRWTLWRDARSRRVRTQSSRTNVTSSTTWKLVIAPSVHSTFCSLIHAPLTLRRVACARSIPSRMAWSKLSVNGS